MRIDGQKAGGEEALDIVPARLLRFLPELLRELGAEPATVLGDRKEWAKPDGGATYRQAIVLLERASAVLGCPDLGMRLAVRQVEGGMFGPLGVVMASSARFEDALRYVCRHAYAHSLATRIWMEPRRMGALFVGHDLLIGDALVQSQTMEQILLLGQLVAQRLTGGRTRARRVHFRHLPVSPLRVYRRRFGCEVRFGESANGLVYARRDLTAPIVAADPRLHQAATRFIDDAFDRHRPPLHLMARSIVRRRLADDGCDAAAVAAELGLHTRTLQRRLAAERTSFQAVKDDVRREAMLYYLSRTDLDLTSIAGRLGFSEQSVLARLCRRWLGTTPTQVRARAGHPAPPPQRLS